MTTSRPAVGAQRPRTIRESYDWLAKAQKSRRGQAYSVFVNRPLGRCFASVAHAAGLRPDQVTVISALFSAAGIAVLAIVRPSLPAAVAVTACLIVGYALDSADGQLARLSGTASPAGEWLDHMIDSAKTPLVHLAVAVALYRHGDVDDALLFVPLAFTVVAVVNFSSMLLRDLLTRSAGRGGQQPTDPHSWIYMVARLPQDFGLLCCLMILLPATDVFVAAYAAVFAANLVYLLLAVPRWRREMGALGGTGGSATSSPPGT